MLETKRLLSSWLYFLGNKAAYLVGALLIFGVFVSSSFAQSTPQPDLQSRFLSATDHGRSPTFSGPAAVEAVPTHSSGAMSVYVITNPNDADITVQHTVVDNAGGQPYYFWSEIPARSAVEIHTRDVAQLPDGFSGVVTLSAIDLFSAEIVGYDYPDIIVGEDPTATPTLGDTARRYQIFIPWGFSE